VPLARNPAGAGKIRGRRESAAGAYPKDYSKTIRQIITGLLLEKDRTAKEISQTAGVREKEVYEHLPHIARSAAAVGKKLLVLPFRCLDCGFRFEERKRFTRPSRCPRCKKSHLEPPFYRISSGVLLSPLSGQMLLTIPGE
jgi:transcriptional regulator